MHAFRLLSPAILLAMFSTGAWSFVEIDHLSDQRSTTTGKRSALFTYDKQPYSDTRLANNLFGIMYKAGEYHVHSASFMFQTCYGGGMIDEIRDGYGNVDLAFGAAARHDQVAWAGRYSSYWTDAVRPELTNNQYVDAFFAAYSSDRVGPVAGPYPPRVHKQSGLPISEEPQWAWTRDGNQTRPDSADRYYAVLWAGQADLVADLADINGMYNRLSDEWTALGKPFSIVVLYGDGQHAADGSFLPSEWYARAATRLALDQALWEAADTVDATTQFVFYATGHGSSLTEVIKSSTVVPHDPPPGGMVQFRIDKGEFDGMVVDPDNQPTLEFEYEIDGADPIQVFLNGLLIGQLPTGQSYAALPVSEALLLAAIGVSGDEGGVIGVPGSDAAVSPALGGDAALAADGSASYALSFSIAAGSEATLLSAAFQTGGIAAAVPEPATWTMLLAGLSMVGFWARGRGDIRAT